jgi:hypothetical protein
MGMSDGQFATLNSSVYLELRRVLKDLKKIKGTEEMQERILDTMEMLKSSSKGNGFFPAAE